MRYSILAACAFLLAISARPAHAQLLTPVTAKELLPSVTSSAQSCFASDAQVTNAVFIGVSYQGVDLAMDHTNGKATGWVFRYYSASLDSILWYVGVRVPIVGDVALPLGLDTLTQNLPVSLGKTPLVDPWVDSDTAIAGSMQGGAADFYANNPDAHVELSLLINNTVQNEYIPRGQYWVFRHVSAADTMTCMVHAGSGQPYTCISGDAPKILTNPPMTGRVGDPYTYKVQAFGNPLPFYYLDAYPDGMSIDIRTGRITWTPTSQQAGMNAVTVRASNDAGSDTQQFTITVQGDATGPTITSTPVATAIADKPYLYQVQATGSPAPAFSLDLAPAGMIIEPNRGAVHWTPKRSQAGKHSVSIRAANTAGSDVQSFEIDVFTSPVVIAIAPQHARAERLFQFTATANAYPSATFTKVSGPSGLSVQPTGLIEWTPTVDDAGDHTVEIRAANTYGFDVESFNINVDGTVGVSPLGRASRFHLNSHYPNPARASSSTTLFVSAELQEAGTLQYVVHDVLGRRLREGGVSSARTGTAILPLDIGGLKPGMYVFTLSDGRDHVTGSFTIID